MRLRNPFRSPSTFPLKAGADAGAPVTVTEVPAFNNEDDEAAYTDAFCDLLSSDDPEVIAAAQASMKRLGVVSTNLSG